MAELAFRLRPAWLSRCATARLPAGGGTGCLRVGGIVECIIRKIAVVQCARSRRRLDLCRDTRTHRLMVADRSVQRGQEHRWLCHRRDEFQVQVGREQTKCSSTGKLASLPRGYAGAMNRRSYYMRGRTMQRFRRLSKVDGCGYLGWAFLNSPFGDQVAQADRTS